MSWLGNLLLIEVLPRKYWLFLAFQSELAVETLKTEHDKHTTAGQSDRLPKKTCFVPVLSVCSVVCWNRAEVSTDRRTRIVPFSSFTCKINFHCYFICMLRFSWCSSTLNWNEQSECNSINLYFHSQISVSTRVSTVYNVFVVSVFGGIRLLIVVVLMLFFGYLY